MIFKICLEYYELIYNNAKWNYVAYMVFLMEWILFISVGRGDSSH